jgi:hypothetical protein
MEENNTFNYSYSAEEQAEIEKIKSKYMPKTEDKMEKLRRLDESVTSMATTWSLVLGVTGTIVMGAGMSLTMTDLYKALSMSPTAAMVVGIILGLIGMGVAAVAYPVYNLVLERMRKKIAPEILLLAEELEK